MALMPLYNPAGDLIGYVKPDTADPGKTAARKQPAARRKSTKYTRQHDKRVKAAVAYVTMRSGKYGVTHVARVLYEETAFQGCGEATIRQFLYKLVKEGVIGKTDDGYLYCPPVPDDASSLTVAVAEQS